MTSPDYQRWAELSDRDASGDALTGDERRFLVAYAETDPLARAEVELWDAMADLTAEESPQDRALAERALELSLHSHRRGPAARRAWLAWAGGGLAVAAAAALWITNRGPSGSLVESVVGEARSAGAALRPGSRVALGSEVEAIGGPVCVAFEPRIHACLAKGSRARLTAVGVAERRLDLTAGRVAIALDPLPKGQRFSVVANGVWSTAVGTAFTVEVEPNGEVRTVVHEGKVAVGSEEDGEVVPAHKIGLSHGGVVTISALVDHTRTETPEWAALGKVASRSIEGPMPEAAPALGLPQASPPEAAFPPVEPEARPHAPAPSRDAVEKAPAATVADLLADARQALRDKRWAAAATSYRQLVSAHPASAEARTVVVPLAKLEIDRLGQPAAGLKRLDGYLAGGGSLAMEARLARIRAFRALGNPSDELKAIDEYLAAHPSGLEAGKLRERREALGAR